MAFRTPQHVLDQVPRAIKEQYAPEQWDEVFAILEPFLRCSDSCDAPDTRVSLCILHLAQGQIDRLRYYAKCAEEDYRNVIFWAENPSESALDTPDKIEDFQQTLEFLGLPRDATLDQEKTRLLAETPGSAARRKPWWKFW